MTTAQRTRLLTSYPPPQIRISTPPRQQLPSPFALPAPRSDPWYTNAGR
jgi:hypothetical protein